MVDVMATLNQQTSTARSNVFVMTYGCPFTLTLFARGHWDVKLKNVNLTVIPLDTGQAL